MLKDLSYHTTQPSGIYSMIARINGVDLSCEKNYFEHYETGVYRHNGYVFNFDGFIEERCIENIIDKWVMYGVCDDYSQILEKYNSLLNNPNKNYVVGDTKAESGFCAQVIAKTLRTNMVMYKLQVVSL